MDVLPEKVGKFMGLKQGDIILSINGRQVNSEAMLEEILRDSPNLIWVTVLRENGETMELEYRDYERGIRDLGLMLVPRSTGKYYPLSIRRDYYQGYGTIILADRIVADHLRTGFKLRPDDIEIVWVKFFYFTNRRSIIKPNMV